MRVSIISTIKYQMGKKEFINSLIETQLMNGINGFRFNAHRIKTFDEAIAFINDIEYWRKKNKGFIFWLDISVYKSKPRIYYKESKKRDILIDEELIIGSKNTCEDIIVDMEKIGNHVKEGQVVLIGDGQYAMQVYEVVNDEKIKVRSCNDFCLVSGKGVYGLGLKHSEKIKKEWEFIIKKSFPDKVIISFVENYNDAIALQDIFPIDKTILKVETKEGVDNIDEILSVGAEIMVGRGDLGMFLGVNNFYNVQNGLLRKLSENGKNYSVATDLLNSLSKRCYPSRADIVDISNILQYNPSAIIITYDLVYNNRVLEAVRVVNALINGI